MEAHYAEIAYVELKKNIHIPNEWPIQGIEKLLLCLTEKIISDPGTSYIVEVNNVPAKLIRQTESDCVYVFQKILHKNMKNPHLFDLVLPIGDHEIRVEIFCEYQEPWPNHSATALSRERKMSYQTIPPCYKKKLRSTVIDPIPRCMLRKIKRIFK